MKTFMLLPVAAMLASGIAVPVSAERYDNRDRQEERRDDRNRVQEERREYQEARRYGDRGDIREERREFNDARRERAQNTRDWRVGRNYDYNRPPPGGRYYADRYYRDGRYYQPRYLGANERIYRGSDNRYYCRRSDGSTGLIIGAVGGGVLGNAIAPGDSRTIGTLAGGVLGALLGQSIDRGNQRVQCR